MATRTICTSTQNEPAATLSCNLSIVDSSTPTAVKLLYCEIWGGWKLTVWALGQICPRLASDNSSVGRTPASRVRGKSMPCSFLHALAFSAGHVEVKQRYPESIHNAPHRHTQFSISGPGRRWFHDLELSSLDTELFCISIGQLLTCINETDRVSRKISSLPAASRSSLTAATRDRPPMTDSQVLFGIAIHAAGSENLMC